MEILLMGLMGIISIVCIIGLSKFFSLCYDMRKIRSEIETFTKYYYQAESYKISKETPK